MTCDSLESGIFFQFMESGLVVEPEEVDYRSNREDYAHCQFIVPDYKGDRIAENYKEAEPVNMVIDGYRAHRFYAPPDMISFRRKMSEPTRAKIDLLDAQQVLQRGTIQKTWDTATFGEIVRYIFSNRDDPYNVLKDYKFYIEEEIEEQVFGGGIVGGGDETGISSAFSTEPVADFVANNVKQLQPISDAFWTEPSFDGVSPAQALQKAAATLNQWVHVDETGTLLIGDFGARPVTHTIADNKDIVLSRYDIVASSNMTNSVRLIGGSARKYLKSVDITESEARLRPVAEASVPGISGSAIEITSDESKQIKKIQDIATLRSVATRGLLNELASDSGGSLVINGLASDDKKSIASMEVGNQLAVDPVITQGCQGITTTGYFLITNLQHNFDGRRGWQATLELSQTAQIDQIEVQTFWYDPQSEQIFDSLTSFNEYQEQDVLSSPFPDISTLL